MKIVFSNLFLEVTRRCNTGCSYCLRGEQQNIDITKECLEKVFSFASEVKELVLTGGEPLLATEALENMVSAISENKVKIGHFRIITSLVGFDAEKSFSIVDKLHELSSEPLLDYIELSQDHEKKAIDEKKSKLIKQIRLKHNYAFQNNDIHNHWREGFNGCMIASGKAKNLNDSFNPSYLNGFNVEDGSVLSDVYVSCNGNVVTSCDLSYDLIDNDNINFGNVLATDLCNIVNSNCLPLSELKEIEVPNAGEISFSQYWESLDENKRGDCFGYVYNLLYGRNMVGFGVFELLKNHDRLKNLKELENFVAIMDLEDSAEPPWFTEKDRKFVDNMKLEFTGYMKMVCYNLYVNSPMFELLDLYYHDLPYCANKRLHRFVENLCDSCIPQKDKNVNVRKNTAD